MLVALVASDGPTTGANNGGLTWTRVQRAAVQRGVAEIWTATAVTQRDGSAIYGVGIDFDRAVARTVPTGQTKVHEFLAPSGDTMWMQSLNATTAPAGTTVTLNNTAPTRISGTSRSWKSRGKRSDW